MLILLLIGVGLLLIFTDFLKINLMFICLAILILLIIICAARLSNNEDLIVKNCKNENDYENIKNAKKVFRKSKVAKNLMLLIYAIIIILLLCAFTDIDFQIIDFISTDIISKESITFNYNLFFIPIYIYVIRECIIQVKIGEFLLKFFNDNEPIPPEINLKSLLYKKKKTK